MKESLVTVIYPCYNQPHILAASLRSLVNQTRKDFTVLLVDDCSTMDYNTVIAAFPQLRITRVVNEKNLGAVPNMLHCIRYPIETAYKVVFHEDDLLHPQWLEFAVKAMQQQKGMVSWAASNMSFFKEANTVSFEQYKAMPQYLVNDVHTLASAIVKGRTLSFASVVYDTAYTGKAFFLLDEYSMLGDRHLLLEMGKHYGFVYFDINFVAAYDHKGKDYRWKTLKPVHICNFYNYLRTFFSAQQLKEKEIVSGFTNAILENKTLIPIISATEKLRLFYAMYRAGLFSLKYYLLSFSFLRRIADKLKY
jgi:glycosyltransferase involved in cell wall biosynthesis